MYSIFEFHKYFLKFWRGLNTVTEFCKLHVRLLRYASSTSLVYYPVYFKAIVSIYLKHSE